MNEISRTLKIEEFLEIREGAQESKPSTKTELASVGQLILENSNLPKTRNPVVLRKHDSLKEAMELMVASMSEISFLVSESGELEGMVTLRHSPSIFSSVHGFQN